MDDDFTEWISQDLFFSRWLSAIWLCNLHFLDRCEATPNCSNINRWAHPFFSCFYFILFSSAHPTNSHNQLMMSPEGMIRNDFIPFRASFMEKLQRTRDVIFSTLDDLANRRRPDDITNNFFALIHDFYSTVSASHNGKNSNENTGKDSNLHTLLLLFRTTEDNLVRYDW